MNKIMSILGTIEGSNQCDECGQKSVDKFFSFHDNVDFEIKTICRYCAMTGLYKSTITNESKKKLKFLKIDKGYRDKISLGK